MVFPPYVSMTENEENCELPCLQLKFTVAHFQTPECTKALSSGVAAEEGGGGKHGMCKNAVEL